MLLKYEARFKSLAIVTCLPSVLILSSAIDVH